MYLGFVFESNMIYSSVLCCSTKAQYKCRHVNVKLNVENLIEIWTKYMICDGIVYVFFSQSTEDSDPIYDRPHLQLCHSDSDGEHGSTTHLLHNR